MCLKLVNTGDISCVADTGVIVLGEVHVVQNNDFAFNTGVLFLIRSINFAGLMSLSSYF